MSTTCPSCRHVVELPESGPGTCDNCGATVPPPAPPPPMTQPVDVPPPPHTPLSERAPDSPGPVPQHAAPWMLAQDGSPTPEGEPQRVPASAIVSFVAGLLFFVPVLTQVVGLVAGGIALCRRRRPNERRGIAWVGLGFSIVALPTWLLLLNYLISPTGALPASVGFGRATYSAAGQNEGDDYARWHKTEEWGDAMRRIHRAVTGYRRDFKEWPASVESLAGRYLPSGFTLPPYLTYTPPPQDKRMATDWPLLISDPVHYTADSEELPTPHRLVMRTGGKLDLLESDKAEALIPGSPGQAKPDAEPPSDKP